MLRSMTAIKLALLVAALCGLAAFAGGLPWGPG